MNSVNLIGNLTKDVNLQYTSQNKAYCRFSIAINENDRTNFITCIAWEKQAENMSKFLSKGDKVGISGRLQSGKYDKNGTTIFTLDVVCNRVEFLERKTTQEHADMIPQKNARQQAYDSIDVTEDDLPFG